MKNLTIKKNKKINLFLDINKFILDKDKVKYYLSNMYNMDITLFGFKMNLEILILIGVIYLILVAHTFGGCCNMPLIMEGLKSMDSSDTLKNIDASGNTTDASGNMMKMAMMKKQKEGFTGANTNYGQSSQYTLGDYTPVDTSSWGQPTMTVTPGKPLSKGVKDFLNREEQPIPLPEGEMLMFANTPFKPECCPNAFSTSQGCACMTAGQYNALISRFGNNVPYSEY
jgi:hypothetical protein